MDIFQSSVSLWYLNKKSASADSRKALIELFLCPFKMICYYHICVETIIHIDF